MNKDHLVHPNVSLFACSFEDPASGMDRCVGLNQTSANVVLRTLDLRVCFIVEFNSAILHEWSGDGAWVGQTFHSGYAIAPMSVRSSYRR